MPWSVRGAVALAVVIVSAGLMAPAAHAATITTAFTPVADSFVSSSNASTNYGTAADIRVASSGDTRRGYLRFVVSGLVAPVSSVSLRVFAATSHPSGFQVRKVTNTTWGETTITNANAPSISSSNAGTIGAVTAGTWRTIPLTGVVTGNGTYSIGLVGRGSSTTMLSLGSRESANRPELQITTTDSVAPALTLTSPTAGWKRASPITVAGAAGTAAGDGGSVAVEVFAGSQASGTALQTQSATVTAGAWSTSTGVLADGTYTVRARQSDAHGNTTTATVTFTLDTSAPAPTVQVPADGAQLTSAAPLFSGQAGVDSGDEAAVTVQVYAGSQATGTPVQSLVAGFPGTYIGGFPGGTWTASAAPLADGMYTVRVVQRDAAGNTATSTPSTFTVDTSAPQVTITQPAADSALAGNDVTISGGAGSAPGDNGSVSVELFAGTQASGTPLQTQSATATAGTWSITTGTLADGTYTVRAQQSDSAGNTATSTPHTFTVDTSAPQVTITQPANLATLSGAITFTGTATNTIGDDTTITLNIYGDPQADPVRTVTTTRTAGTWSLTTPSLPDGTYTARAIQRDAAGNTGTSAGVVFRSGATYAQEVLADAPRGFWRLGETSGTTAADLGSGQNAGTYQGSLALNQAGALTGDTDRAVQMGGTTGNIPVTDATGNSLNPGTGDFSVELWMKTTVNNQQSIIGKQGASGGYWQLLVTNATAQLGKLRATFWDGTNQRQAFSSVRIDDGVWHHVVVAFARATGIDIYVDGDRATKTGGLATAITNTSPMQIGKVTGYPYFTGSIDEVAIYGSALSQSRVTAHLAASRGPDVTGPATTITGPASPTSDPRPTLTGRAGTQIGDTSQMTIKVYAGATATGTPLQSLTTTASAAGAWSVNADALADGTYTALVSQRDNAGNSGSGSRTFTISAPTAPPDQRAAVLASQPAAYWRLGEGAGTATGDETGNNDAGALLGGAQFAPGAVIGDSDTGLTFDGVDDEVNFGDPASGALDLGTSDLTVEGWLKTTSTAQQAVLGKQGSSGAYWQFLVTNTAPYAGRIRATFSDGTTTRQFFSSQRVDNGAWHHFAVTFRRGTGVDFYVDGYRDFRASTLSGSLSNGAPLQLGRLTGYTPFSGSLDEVALYTRALPASEIAAHHAEGTSAESTTPAPTLTGPTAATTTDTTPRFAGTVGVARGDLPTATIKVYTGSEPAGAPVRTLEVIAGSDGKWSREDGTALSPGTYTAQVEQADTTGGTGRSAAVTFVIESPPASGDDPALIAAGDIASCGSALGHKQTAALLGQLTGEIQTLGDNAYEHGSATDFACFDQAWGPYKSRIHPALGDHEYDLGNANPYFAYFGAVAGDPAKGYYAYDVGTWRVVVTNAVCEVLPGGCDTGGAQDTWLRGELASSARQCTIAVIGAPRYSSGTVHGNGYEYTDMWKALYDGGVDVVLNGDDHVYERFAPQTPYGQSDAARGIRQFTVGTGGYYLYDVGPPQPLSEERRAGTHGVLRLSLHPGSYDWRFHAVAGSTYTDTGSAPCS